MACPGVDETLVNLATDIGLALDFQCIMRVGIAQRERIGLRRIFLDTIP